MATTAPAARPRHAAAKVKSRPVQIAAKAGGPTTRAAAKVATKTRGAAGDAATKTRGSAKAAVRRPSENVLMAEYLTCMIILVAGTIVAPTTAANGVPRLMVKATALSAVFVFLALLSAGGSGLAKGAGGLGALITLSYVVVSSDAHEIVRWIGGFYSPAGVAGS